MILADGWFSGFSAVSSLVLSIVSIIVAALAAAVAYRAARGQHWDVVTDRLHDSLGDLLGSVIRINFAAQELSRSSGDQLNAARQSVLPDFVNFRESVARVRLALKERPTSPAGLGLWVMDVANNLANSLLMADQFGADWEAERSWAAGLSDVERPPYVPTDHHWSVLVRSASFWTAYFTNQSLLPPPPSHLGFKPVDEWWSTRNPYLYSGYSDVGWIAQHARLLSDFGEQYITPWAEDLVSPPEALPLGKPSAREGQR